jgi:hypothetical protein
MCGSHFLWFIISQDFIFGSLAFFTSLSSARGGGRGVLPAVNEQLEGLGYSRCLESSALWSLFSMKCEFYISFNS